jgi:pimeloyl-ACP methyl ester carboxylesterase
MAVIAVISISFKRGDRSMHMNEFFAKYPVQTMKLSTNKKFDYRYFYNLNAKHTADAVAELLNRLEVKAWLVGQSLGGIVAQIIAKEHPEVVEGMVLSYETMLSLV